MSDAPRDAAPDRGGREWLAFGLWMAIAAALRFGGLERWSLWGDEAHTLSDVLDLDDGLVKDKLKAYPLLYLFEWLALKVFASAPVEFALRFVTASSATLAVGAMFRCSRGLVSVRTRHLLAAFVTFSPWFLFHAQFARFYAPLFALSAVGSLLFLRAMRSGNSRDMALSVLALVAGGLTHPTCWSLFVGLLAASLLSRRNDRVFRSKMLAAPLAVVALFAIVVVFFKETYVRTVVYKVLLQDVGADSVVDLVQGVVYNFGLAPSALALLGMGTLWRHRRRLCLEVTVSAGLAIAVVFTLALAGSSVEQRYLIPVMPLLLIPAAAQLDELIEVARRRSTLAAVVVVALAFVPFVPGLASHYLDGNRHDLRGAAEFIDSHADEADLVVSENHFLMGWYLPTLDEERLIEAPPQAVDGGMLVYREAMDAVRSRGGRLWVVLPTYYRDLGGDEEAFFEWATHEGHLRDEQYHRRFDYHQNRLQVFEVDPNTAARWIPVEEH